MEWFFFIAEAKNTQTQSGQKGRRKVFSIQGRCSNEKINASQMMNEETYVKKDFAQVPGQQFYYTFKGKVVKNKFEYI